MLLRYAWLFAWVILVGICTTALIDVSMQTCSDNIPILLSRALTTDPYRGFLLAYCLIVTFYSILLGSIGLIAAMFGFFSAFTVSMFDTPTTHDALIAVSSILVMYECNPQGQDHLLWNIHWWSTVVLCVVFVTWLISSTSCDSVFCEECSWWYISEYLLFWSMFLLVYWRIPMYGKLVDTIPFASPECSPEGSQEGSRAGSRAGSREALLTSSNLDLDF